MTITKKQPVSIFNPSLLISTLFWTGKIKYCPGTFGSIIPALEFYLYFELFNLREISSYFFHLLIMTPIFFIAISTYIKNHDDKDPKEVVADEYLGQYLAQLLSYYFLSLVFPNQVNLLWIILASLIWFRIFDILKPSLVGYCDKNFKGAIGIMLDDIVAGLFAALTTTLLFSLYYVIT
jgi:phosphatidylglycerophosphatase A